MLLWTFVCKFLCEHMFSLLLGKYLALELLGNMVNVSLTIRGTARLFSCTVLCIYFSVGHI